MATQLRDGRYGRMPRLAARARQINPRDLPSWSRLVIAFAFTLALLLALQGAAFAATRIPVEITVSGTDARFSVDGRVLRLALPATPTQVVFVPGSPLLREYQIDGTDDTNNFTEDASYVLRMADQPYFRFQNWMRDSASYSTWYGVTARSAESSPPAASARVDSNSVRLPAGQRVIVSGSLMRLEMPAEVLVVCGADPCAQLTINRNDRVVQTTVLLPGGVSAGQSSTFFPVGALPFAAEVAYLLAHVALWSLAMLGILIALQSALSIAVVVLRRQMPLFDGQAGAASGRDGSSWFWRPRGRDWDRPALVVITCSFLFTCFIALAQYQAQPHILDASAYVMQAKIFASGRLAAPVPANLSAFQGPFMVAHNGRWFAQYPPGTSLLLAAGFLLNVPWVVEPLLGALALWGIYRLGCAWFGRATALLAVLLGALSPFFSYLVASYLSHAPALFFEVFFLLFLTAYTRRRRTRDLIFAAACWGGLLLTREFSAALVGLWATAYIAATQWRRLWEYRSRLARDALLALTVALAGCALYLLYNRAQTGSALTTPRVLFSPADHPGFGKGIGFYGQHTVAAGFVNLDELLTSLSIDLFGWPFDLTLAFIPLAFLAGRARPRWELFCATTAALLALAQMTYFYHGIYLGPRYLFETLPFLLLLSARGITNLPPALVWAGRQLMPDGFASVRAAARLLTLTCVGALVLCNLVYYLPRQLSLHQNFSGLAVAQPVDVGAIYRLHPTNAVVVTSDWYVYSYVVWPLNAPSLSGSTLYAYATSPGAVSTLRGEYPGRRFYQLVIGVDGAVRFEPLSQEAAEPWAPRIQT